MTGSVSGPVQRGAPDPPEPPNPASPTSKDWALNQIRGLNDEARSFVALALAFFAPQVAVAGALVLYPPIVFPQSGAIFFVLVDDGLTALFALATMARFDLAMVIAQLYRPWVGVDRLLRDADPHEGHWLARGWFHLEEALYGQRPGRDAAFVSRAVYWARRWRQVPTILVMLAMMVGVGALILHRCTGPFWPSVPW